MWYMVRGQVDKRDFVRELQREFGLTAQLEDVNHAHARLMPAGSQMPGVMTIMLSDPGRGAFPITILDANARSLREAGGPSDG